MVFKNKIDSNDQKYKTNGTVRYENYEGNSLFPTKYFVLFGTDIQSIFFMSTRFLKDSIDGVRVPQFQLYYIIDTTHTTYIDLLQFFHNLNYMCCGKQ